MLKTEKKARSIKRSRIDIMASVVENCNESTRKARLLYGCNLSSSKFNLYKEFLLEAGLLKTSTREDGVEIFETTEKGREFLTDYAQIRLILHNQQERR